MISQEIAKWAKELQLDSIPESVIHSARRCVLDGVGVAVAGSRLETPKQLRKKIQTTYCSGNCTVIGSDYKLQAEAAAFSNAISGHSLDFDDTCYSGIAHATVVVLPAVIAAAEEVKANGDTLLTSFICGVETIYALGRGFGDEIYWDGWWTSSLLGGIGAAVAVAKVYGGNEAQIASAIEFAATQTTGRRVVFGNTAKAIGIGKASSLGIEAAKLALEGFTSPIGSIDGKLGMINLFNKARWNSSCFDLGKSWGLIRPGIAFKMYPCCSAAQATINAAKYLFDEFGVTSDKVKSLKVDVTPFVEECLIFDFPSNITECQFSLQFPLACLLQWGQFDNSHLSSNVIEDKNIQRLMKLIDKSITEELVDIQNTSKENLEAARVTVRLTDGRDISRLVMTAKGMPENPVNDQEIKDKFSRCTQFDEKIVNSALNNIWEIDSHRSIDLHRLLFQ